MKDPLMSMLQTNHLQLPKTVFATGLPLCQDHLWY